MQGDLNHPPERPEYRRWLSAGLVDTFAAAGRGPGLTMPVLTPLWRIDYVLAAGPIADRVHRSGPITGPPFSIPVTDPTAFALSDHMPQQADFV